MIKHLILVPTQLEFEAIRAGLRLPSPASETIDIEVCGFGIVAAAARSMQLIAQHKPDSVFLTGIAGAYDNRLTVGEAYQFSQISVYGIGVGCGDEFQTAGSMGWKHCEQPVIGDTISVAENGHHLLTCCSSAADPNQALARLRVFPTADAEDMEGFAVALACAISNCPLRVVRGISNVAGERDHAGWQISRALESACELTSRLISDELKSNS